MGYPKKAYFKDHVFEVDEHVYEPAEDTFLVAEQLDTKKDDIVLEIGTGCGILAILAAKTAKKVVAIDINPYAIDCAKRNAKNNNLIDRIEFRQGNLFEPIKDGEQFSLIVFNSPYLPSEPDEEKSWIGKAWAGGKTGRQVIEPFIAAAPSYLAVNGRMLLVQSSLSDVDKTIKMFNELNLQAKVVSQVKFPFESIVLIEANR
jgi:release factor glutamine methyltransferase